MQKSTGSYAGARVIPECLLNLKGGRGRITLGRAVFPGFRRNRYGVVKNEPAPLFVEDRTSLFRGYR